MTWDLKGFIPWYKGITQLRVFWARPLISFEALKVDEGLVIRGRWRYRRGEQAFVLFVNVAPEPEEGRVNLYLGTEELDCRKRGVVFFYRTDNDFLELNQEVRVELADDLRLVEMVQRRSWGFFVPPPPGRVVLLALDDGPVGSVYVNPENGNLDYGVHVIRERWRQRIGTRLLVEAAHYLRERGLPRMSVVRVLGRGSDKRALSFYRANKPLLELKACELG